MSPLSHLIVLLRINPDYALRVFIVKRLIAIIHTIVKPASALKSVSNIFTDSSLPTSGLQVHEERYLAQVHLSHNSPLKPVTKVSSEAL